MSCFSTSASISSARYFTVESCDALLLFTGSPLTCPSAAACAVVSLRRIEKIWRGQQQEGLVEAANLHHRLILIIRALGARHARCFVNLDHEGRQALRVCDLIESGSTVATYIVRNTKERISLLLGERHRLFCFYQLRKLG